MDQLKDLLSHRLNNHHLGEAAKAAGILHAANQFLKTRFPQSPDSAKAYRLEHGNLYVRAENSSWAQELWGVQDKLLRSLQKTFGENAIQKVVLKWFDISERGG